MRIVSLVLVAGCSQAVDTGPIGGVDPNPTPTTRIQATWDLFDSVGPTTCPADYVVEVFAPPDAQGFYPCDAMEATLQPVPTGDYVAELRLYDAADTVVDEQFYFVTLTLGSEDGAYAAFLLP